MTIPEMFRFKWTTRDKVIIAMGTVLWLFVVFRYYPGDPGRSMWETGVKIFWSSGLALIFTRILVRFLTWIEKTRPSPPRIVKIFLALLVAFGIMLAIEDFRKHYSQTETKASHLKVIPSPGPDAHRKCSG